MKQPTMREIDQVIVVVTYAGNVSGKIQALWRKHSKMIPQLGLDAEGNTEQEIIVHPGGTSHDVTPDEFAKATEPFIRQSCEEIGPVKSVAWYFGGLNSKKKTARPELNEVPIPENPFQPGTVSATIRPGQWDNLIKAMYEHGHLLLEVETVNGEETIVRAYQKPKS